MADIFERLRDFVEPAHPGVIKMHEDLLVIYKIIRERYQVKIDTAFDHISKKIGFVVATTMPFKVEVAEMGKGVKVSIGVEHLQKTIFDSELSEVLKSLSFDNWKNDKASTFDIYVIWYDALRLKLKTHWLEPAHFFGLKPNYEQYTLQNKPTLWDMREPAHWFDPRIKIELGELLHISVIDEVYPELKLSERIMYSRDYAKRQFGPGMHEPVHSPYDAKLMVDQRLTGRYPSEIQEPVHFKGLDERLSADKLPAFLAELNALLKRYGY